MSIARQIISEHLFVTDNSIVLNKSNNLCLANKIHLKGHLTTSKCMIFDEFTKSIY